MKRTLDRIFSSPLFPQGLIFAGKFSAVGQMIVSAVLFGFSRRGAPVGCLTYVEAMQEAALTTLTVTACFAVVYGFLRQKNDAAK